MWVMIPARLASSRLPGKPLLDLEGLPIVEHVRRRALASRAATRVVVVTEDEAIADVVARFGGEVIRTGPAPNGTARVAAAASDAPVPVINVQGDMPRLDPSHVDAVARLLQRGARIATLSAPWPADASLDDPALVKVGPGPVFTRAPIPGARLHVGLYGFAPGALAAAAAAPPSARSRIEDLEQLAWIDAGLPVTVGEVDRSSPGVDTPAQLAALRAGARDPGSP